MSTHATFTIGELAERAGITRDALRYYERLGVIPRALRTSGGFRVYSAEVLTRVRFIKQAQRHGLTLAEIRELLRLDKSRGPSQCRPGFPIWSWYPAPQNRRLALIFLGSDATNPATKGDTPWVRKNPSPFSSPSTAF